MRRNSHVRFGGGPLEKGLLNDTEQIPRHAAYPAGT